MFFEKFEDKLFVFFHVPAANRFFFFSDSHTREVETADRFPDGCDTKPTAVSNAIIGDIVASVNGTANHDEPNVFCVVYGAVFRQFHNFQTGSITSIRYRMAHLFLNAVQRFPSTPDQFKFLRLCEGLSRALVRHGLERFIADKFSDSLYENLIAYKKAEDSLRLLNDSFDLHTKAPDFYYTFVHGLLSLVQDGRIETEDDLDETRRQCVTPASCETLTTDGVTRRLDALLTSTAKLDAPSAILTKLSRIVYNHYLLLSLSNDTSPNTIINKYYKDNQQEAFNVKKIRFDDGRSPASLMKNRVFVVIDDVTPFVRPPETNVLHFNLNSNDRFGRYVINVSLPFAKDLLTKQIIFAIEPNSTFAETLGVGGDFPTVYNLTVYVRWELLREFVKKLRKYISSRHSGAAPPTAVIDGLQLDYSFTADRARSIRVTDDIESTAAAAVGVPFVYVENGQSQLPVPITRTRLQSHHVVDFYTILSEKCFAHVLRHLTCQFFIKHRVVFKRHAFYYVHVYVSNVYSVQFLTACKTFSDRLNHKTGTRTIGGGAPAGETGDPQTALDVIWAAREHARLVYTSDCNSLVYDVNPALYIKNYTFATYVSTYKACFLYPQNQMESTRFMTNYIKSIKTIVSDQKKFYFVDPYVDGPLKNVISIRALESLTDDRILDKEYTNASCTTLRTVLNIPSLVDLQSPENVVYF